MCVGLLIRTQTIFVGNIFYIFRKRRSMTLRGILQSFQELGVSLLLTRRRARQGKGCRDLTVYKKCIRNLDKKLKLSLPATFTTKCGHDFFSLNSGKKEGIYSFFGVLARKQVYTLHAKYK